MIYKPKSACNDFETIGNNGNDAKFAKIELKDFQA